LTEAVAYFKHTNDDIDKQIKNVNLLNEVAMLKFEMIEQHNDNAYLFIEVQYCILYYVYR